MTQSFDMSNRKSLFAIAAAFLAGVLIFVPFVTLAQPKATLEGGSGEVVIVPNTRQFLIKNGNRISLWEVNYDAKSHLNELELQDTKPIP